MIRSPKHKPIELDDQSTALLTLARERTGGLLSKAYLPGDKRVALLVTDAPQKGTNFRIDKTRVLVGRSKPETTSEADIAIEDSKISRKHCVLELHGLSALLVDLDSANGTFVAGKKIESCQLDNFSEFQIGTTTIVLAIT